MRTKLLSLLIFLSLIATGCSAAEAAFVNTDTPLNVTDSTLDGISIIDSGLKVSDEPYFVEISEGNVAGHTPVSRFGFNAAVGTSIEDIWLGSSLYVFPTVAQQMSIVSNSAQDAADGSGARTVTVFYLDSNYGEHTEVVSMNGTTAVLTTATNIFRVNEFMTATVGSNSTAVGQITISAVGGTPIYRYIFPGFNRSRGSHYTVPAGKTLFINHWTTGVGGLNAANLVRVTFRSTYNDVSGAQLTAGLFFIPQAEIAMPNGVVDRHFDFPLKFPAGTDIKVSAFTDGGSCSVETTWRGWTE